MRGGYVERPVRFGRENHLVGINCRPTEAAEAQDRSAFLFLNAGAVHRVGPHRIHVTLARALAGHGIPSLRFDFSGIGDSRVRSDDTGSRADAVQADLADALEALLSRDGSVPVIMVGLCSGADHAFDAAICDERIAGCVLIDPDVHLTPGHRSRRLRAAARRPAVWRALVTGRHPFLKGMVSRMLGRDQSPEVTGLAVTSLPARRVRESQIKTLLGRGVELHYIFTGGLLERYNHRRQLYEAYPGPDLATRARLDWFPDCDHTFSGESCHRRLLSAVCEWAETTFGAAAPTSDSNDR